MTVYTLGKVDDFEELQARGFDLAPPDEAKRVFIIKKRGEIFAYRNICPHTGAPLNWNGDRFLDREEKYLQCALHGALFRVESGYCFAGPCSGQSLTTLSTIVSNGQLFIDL